MQAGTLLGGEGKPSAECATSWQMTPGREHRGAAVGPWVPLGMVGLTCHGKYLRVRRALERVMLDSTDPTPRIFGVGPRVRLPLGAVGYCYRACPGVLFVGSYGGFGLPPRHVSPARYDYCVRIWLDEVA